MNYIAVTGWSQKIAKIKCVNIWF